MKGPAITNEFWDSLLSDPNNPNLERLNSIYNELRQISDVRNNHHEEQQQRMETITTTNEGHINEIENNTNIITTTLTEATTEINRVGSYWPMLGVLGVVAITAIAYLYFTNKNQVSENVTFSLFGVTIFEKKLINKL